MHLSRALAAAALLLVSFVVACPGPDPHGISPTASATGTGGAPDTMTSTGAFPGTTASVGTSSTTGSTSSSTTGTGGSVSATASTGTGAPPCMDGGAACPPTGTLCRTPACLQGACTGVPATTHTHCNDSGGSVCNGSGACVGCVDRSDCPQGDVCTMTTTTTSACIPGLLNGAPCTDATLCSSGICVEGVCCNQACPGPCMACTGTASANGTCGPIAANTDPENGCAVACNGQGACQPGTRVFVTHATFPGTFGSGGTNATGGDALCQMAAKVASLGGTWMAWTSDATNTPAHRFNHSTSPYLLLDKKTVIAENWTALTNEPLMAPIELDETMATVHDKVWTGTSTAGVASGENCLNWQGGNGAVGDVGDSSQTGSTWTFPGSDPLCTTSAHLYCFEQ